jgi:hypothetical protein
MLNENRVNQILGGNHQQCEEDDHNLPTKETHFKVISKIVSSSC